MDRDVKTLIAECDIDLMRYLISIVESYDELSLIKVIKRCMDCDDVSTLRDIGDNLLDIITLCRRFGDVNDCLKLSDD